MNRFIAKYRVRIKGTLQPTPWFYVRYELDPNASSWATRFASREAAEDALRELRNNFVARQYTGFAGQVEEVA